ncbi:MAG: hypothetical protein ACHQIM_04815 [Sphingobacteriales bacterium]
MAKQNTPEKPIEIPQPEKEPEIKPPDYPEEPVIPAENPDLVPYEAPFETPPYETPPPGEGF